MGGGTPLLLMDFFPEGVTDQAGRTGTEDEGKDTFFKSFHPENLLEYTAWRGHVTLPGIK